VRALKAAAPGGPVRRTALVGPDAIRVETREFVNRLSVASPAHAWSFAENDGPLRVSIWDGLKLPLPFTASVYHHGTAYSTRASAVVLTPFLAPALTLLFGMFGWKVALLYLGLGLSVAIVAGWIIGIPFVFMFPVMNNPDSTLSVVLSLFPPFAPVLFFLRMSVQFPPTWQVVLCLVLLLGTIAAVARFAAAIYRVGILMYGKRPTFREVLRWAKES